MKMRAKNMYLGVATFVTVVFVWTQIGNGAVLYESATLGQTGISAQDVLNQVTPGSSLAPNIFQGVRFKLPIAAEVSRIGGHFIGFGEGGTPDGERGRIFGAIVSLSGEFDLPDSNDLSTSDVVGTTLIDLHEKSYDVYGELSLTLIPGWYALVFGGGLFGADLELGVGATLRNNTEIGNPQYLGRQDRWRVRSGSAANQRFVVEGTTVPEPSTLALIASGLILLALQGRVSRGTGRISV